MIARPPARPTISAAARRRTGCGVNVVLMALAGLCLAIAARGEQAKPEKTKLPGEVEAAFATFVATSKEAHKDIARKHLKTRSDEVARSVKLTAEQRAKLETEAEPAVAEWCDKFAGNLDTWLRPFLAEDAGRAMGMLGRWKPAEYATRPNVFANPQDAKSWGEALKRVLNAEQLAAHGKAASDRAASPAEQSPAVAAEAKADKPKLSDEVEKAFATFLMSTKEARKPLAEADLIKLCNEVAKSVKLTDEQRKKLEAEAAPAVGESCEKFAEKLDVWLRPFLAGYSDSALTNLNRWKPQQFASRNNVAASPQDTKAWEEAVKSVLTPGQLTVYQQDLGDRAARRKREIADYLKDALAVRRGQLSDLFKLEREGIAREITLDKERTAKLAAAEKATVDVILADDEKVATEQLMGASDDSWKQMFGSGGTYQFEGNTSKQPPTRRESWTKALSSVLSPDELKRWEAVQNRRQERRERAAMMGAVAELEDKILLSPEQRPKLEKLFLERWRRNSASSSNEIQIYPMNLLRNGSDGEVRDLLSKHQQGRWDEFVRSSNGNARNDAAPDKKKDKSAASVPVDPERVFAAHFVKIYHSQRDRMMAGMQDRVDELARVTSLSGAPLKLLQVAAKGSVERVLEGSWKGNVDRNVRANVEGVGAAFLQQRLEAMGESRYNIEGPEHHALWVQTLKTTLTDEQRKLYESVLADRDAYRDKAIVQILLAQLDSTLRISSEQADKLEPLIAGVVKDYWPDYQRTFSGNSYAIYPYYLPVLLSGVPEKDRKAILTPEQQKQFDADTQSRFSGWWDNMKRQHDTRMKAKAE